MKILGTVSAFLPRSRHSINEENKKDLLKRLSLEFKAILEKGGDPECLKFLAERVTLLDAESKLAFRVRHAYIHARLKHHHHAIDSRVIEELFQNLLKKFPKGEGLRLIIKYLHGQEPQKRIAQIRAAIALSGTNQDLIRIVNHLKSKEPFVGYLPDLRAFESLEVYDQFVEKLRDFQQLSLCDYLRGVCLYLHQLNPTDSLRMLSGLERVENSEELPFMVHSMGRFVFELKGNSYALGTGDLCCFLLSCRTHRRMQQAIVHFRSLFADHHGTTEKWNCVNEVVRAWSMTSSENTVEELERLVDLTRFFLSFGDDSYSCLPELYKLCKHSLISIKECRTQFKEVMHEKSMNQIVEFTLSFLSLETEREKEYVKLLALLVFMRTKKNPHKINEWMTILKEQVHETPSELDEDLRKILQETRADIAKSHHLRDYFEVFRTFSKDFCHYHESGYETVIDWVFWGVEYLLKNFDPSNDRDVDRMKRIATILVSNLQFFCIGEEDSQLPLLLEFAEGSQCRSVELSLIAMRARNAPSTKEAPYEARGEAMLRLNLPYIRETCNHFQVKWREVPAHLTLELWESMISSFQSMMHKDSSQEAVRDLCDWQEVNTRCFLDKNFFEGLFPQHSDHELNPIQIHFFSTFNFLASLSSESRGVLSEKEEALLRFGMSVQACSGGKKEGITDYYNHVVPAQYKLIDIQAPEYYINQIYQNWLNSSLSSNREMVNKMCGFSNHNNVKELAHYSIYLKNVLGSKLGLAGKFSYDPHIGVVSSKLLNKKTDALLEDFFEYNSLKGLLDYTVFCFNRESQEFRGAFYKDCVEVHDEMQNEDYWDFKLPQEGGTYVKEEGVFQLMLLYRLITQ